MKKHILLCLLLFSGILTLAQTRVNVYTNDGQQYRNVYLQSQADDHIIINLNEPGTADPILVRLSIERIRRIHFIQKKPGHKDRRSTSEEDQKPGLYFGLEFGGIVGRSNSNDENNTNLMLRGMAGYSFKKYLSAGMGLGVDNYDDFTLMPVFLDVRGDIIQSRVMPFYYIQTGYSASWFNDRVESDFVKENIEANWMFNPGLGMRIDLGRSDIILSMGYKHQEVKITREFDWGESMIERREMNRMVFGIGLIF